MARICQGMGEIVGILLAAGGSTRFGGDKLVSPLPNGISIAVAAARNLGSALTRTIVVVRPGHDRLEALLTGAGCELVVNDRPESGMGSSLAAGVRASRNAGGWLIALADMPWVSTQTIRQLKFRLEIGASIVAPVYGGKRGHPVGFSAEWGDRLGGLNGRFGARSLIDAAGDALELLETGDAGVVRDVDYPSDVTAGDRVGGG